MISIKYVHIWMSIRIQDENLFSCMDRIFHYIAANIWRFVLYQSLSVKGQKCLGFSVANSDRKQANKTVQGLQYGVTLMWLNVIHVKVLNSDSWIKKETQFHLVKAFSRNLENAWSIQYLNSTWFKKKTAD